MKIKVEIGSFIGRLYDKNLANCIVMEGSLTVVLKFLPKLNDL